MLAAAAEQRGAAVFGLFVFHILLRVESRLTAEGGEEEDQDRNHNERHHRNGAGDRRPEERIRWVSVEEIERAGGAAVDDSRREGRDPDALGFVIEIRKEDMDRHGIDNEEQQPEERRAGISLAVGVAVKHDLRETPDAGDRAGEQQRFFEPEALLQLRHQIAAPAEFFADDDQQMIERRQNEILEQMEPVQTTFVIAFKKTENGYLVEDYPNTIGNRILSISKDNVEN